MSEVKRKGVRRIKDIPVDVLEQLNRGEIETANLVEWLAVDQKLLLKNLLIESQRTAYLQPILNQVDALSKPTVNSINQTIGETLFKLTVEHNDQEFLSTISGHTADLVRCWATYTIGKDEELGIADSLEQIRVFAADKHFGVREISWMAVRKKITDNLKQSIMILAEWTKSHDENIRRFATEAIRPRGVWSAHIDELKDTPEQALSILEPLRSDSAKYVQDSVANWLNDASKTQPDFVQELCNRWLNESDTKETQYIVKKALRTINKKDS